MVNKTMYLVPSENPELYCAVGTKSDFNKAKKVKEYQDQFVPIEVTDTIGTKFNCIVVSCVADALDIEMYYAEQVTGKEFLFDHMAFLVDNPDALFAGEDSYDDITTEDFIRTLKADNGTLTEEKLEVLEDIYGDYQGLGYFEGVAYIDASALPRIDAGFLEELRKEEEEENRKYTIGKSMLVDLQEGLKKNFKDNVKTQMYGNPLLRVTFEDLNGEMTEVSIYPNIDDNNYTIAPASRVLESKVEPETISTPEEVYEYVKHLIPFAEEEAREEKEWEEFEAKSEKILRDVCKSFGITRVYINMLGYFMGIDITITAYKDDDTVFDFKFREEQDKIKLYDIVPKKKVLLETYNMMSYPEAVDTLRDYIENYLRENVSSSRKYTRLSSVLDKLYNR